MICARKRLRGCRRPAGIVARGSPAVKRGLRTPSSPCGILA